MQARLHLDRSDYVMQRLGLAVLIMPNSVRYRDMPAIYAIYAHQQNMMTSRDALTEVNKALELNPNSKYLSIHRAELREQVK